MKKFLLIVAVLIASFQGFSQARYWNGVSSSGLDALPNIKGRTFSPASKYFELDFQTFKQQLVGAATVRTGQDSQIIISIPNISGKMEQYKMWENSNFAPQLQAQYPEIRSYSGIGIDDRTASIYLSVDPSGIKTMVLRADKDTEFMEPYTTDGKYYALYNSPFKGKGDLPFNCSTIDQLINSTATQKSTQSNTQTFKTFRLALSCTGEYTAYFGGTVAGALAGMNATMTRVNGVYEKDLAVKLEIIATNNSVIYTNASTDPYSNASAGSSGAWNQQLQTALTSVVGNANYDIGHLFGASGGGGNAGCIGCVCVDPTTSVPLGKGSGFTSPYDAMPEGDTFDIDYVAHEMGHQLGANHTFTYSYEGSGAQTEVGSGSTIMGYAGITIDYDVQAHSDDYFTLKSIQQIQTNLNSKTCSTDTALTNTPPTVNAGSNYTIPKGTPFILTGTATDAQNDPMTYCWEQNNSGTASTEGANSFASPTKTSGPNFRSFAPKSTPVRYFPALEKVLSGSLSSSWESVSTVARTLLFAFTARDNAAGGGQTSSDVMTMTVSATAGPFDVTSQNTAGIVWTAGQTQTITWAVNNTSTMTGAANVDILLSTDGGQTFPTTLLAGTPNDGTADITVPNTPAPFCRVMVKPTGNVFYDINTQNFSIGYQIVNDCATYTNAVAMAIPDAGTEYSTSTVTIPSEPTAAVSYVNVTVNITHPYIGDVFLAILNPSATQANLFQGSCTNNDNMNVTFSDAGGVLSCGTPVSGTYQPVEPLATFLDEGFQGDWTIGVIDTAADDIGTLNSWSVQICSQTLIPLGVDGYSLETISVYPNPAKNVLNISVPAELGLPDNIAVYNSIGQLVENRSPKSEDQLSLNTTAYSTGVYFVKVTIGQQNRTLRFIKN